MQDSALKVKEKIMKKLKNLEGSSHSGDAGSSTSSYRSMRLFSINGIEMHDSDNIDVLHDDDYVYYSFSKVLFNLE
jgi:hypothetical protein